jgi:PAS domain S-box-containing protein
MENGRQKYSKPAARGLMHSPSALEVFFPHRFRWLIAGTAAIVAAILAAIVPVLVATYHDALDDAKVSLSHQSLSLSELDDHAFQAVDMVLVSVAEKIRRQASTHQDLRQFTNQQTNQFLQEKVAALPEMDTLGILDADGNRINHSRDWPSRGTDPFYGDYSQQLKKNPRTDAFVREPGNAAGAPVVVVARPVLSDTGDFLGVVFATIAVDYFEKLFEETSFGQGYTAALLRNDGMPLAGYPTTGGIGMAVAASVLNRLDKSGSAASGSISSIDEQGRIAAAYKLAHFPLVVVVTRTEYAALSNRLPIVATATAIALMLISIILGSAFLIARSRKQQDQLNAAAFLNAAAENMPQGLVMYDGSQHLIISNEHYRELYGLTREQTKPGTTLRANLAARVATGNSPKDVDDAYVEQRLQKVREGRPYYVEDKLRDGRIIGVSHRLMPGGGWVAIHQDITERKRAEEHQGMLLAELDHRVKNILARVAVVAKYTLEGGRPTNELIQSLNQRVQSMADAHTLLSQSHWRGVKIADLVSGQLAPYATEKNMVISGPDITLAAVPTQALAMVLQELVTNAVKYGSLSTPQGKVSVNWDRRQGTDRVERVVIEWRETGGPLTKAPIHSSYGTNLIRNLIPHELGGTVNLEFAPEGLRCDIEIPLQEGVKGDKVME